MDILSRQLTTAIPDAGLKCVDAWGDTGLQTTPANFSLCITLKMTQAEFDGMINYGLLIGQVDNAAANSPNCNYIYKVGNQFVYRYKSDNLSSARAVYFPTSAMAILLDGVAHKIVAITANDGSRLYVDGVRVANYTSSLVPTEFTSSGWNTSFRIGNHASSMQKGGIFSNVKYFNFDISASGAAYTLEDYQNDKDVPNFSYLLSPSIYNTIGWDYTAWYDAGFTVKSANGEYLTTTYTGADTSASLTILNFNLRGLQIKFKKFHFRVDDIRHNLANAAEQNTVPKWFWVGFTYVDAAGTTQLIRIYNNPRFTSSDFPVVLDYDIPEDWQYITRIYICSDFKNGTTAITEGDSVVYKNLRVWVEDFESINYPETHLNKLSNGKVLELQNKLSGTTWQDESGNGYDMALQGDFEIVDI